LKTGLKLGIGLIISVLLAGCQSIAYYSQAIGGQTGIWAKQRNIESVLADPDVEAKTRQRLEAAREARKFASDKLGLPDNKSYTRYVDLGRDYVVWNVVATPRYSVDAVKSCFLVVGCVSYRGYYKKYAAIKQANRQKQAGLDVYVGGVTAYSTLGWFNDPLLSTMLARSDAAIASLIIHELAHQVVFIKGDTQFNESFATAVEQLGLRQWAAVQGSNQELEDYFEEKAKRDAIIALVLDVREQMRRTYLAYQSAGEDRLAAVKHEQFQALRDRYAGLKQTGGGTAAYDRFFASDLNNASLALFGEYHGWVDAFKRLYEQSGRDWEVFYEAVSVLSLLPKVERDLKLRGLLRG